MAALILKTLLNARVPGPILSSAAPACAGTMAAGARRRDCPGDAPAQGFPPVYSDLGYVLVGLSNLDPPAASRVVDYFAQRMPVTQ